MQQIKNILSNLRPEFDYDSSNNYIEDGMLDSFDIVSLISELEDQYEILIDALDIVPENFQSAETIADLVKKNGGTL